jgi:FkbM family methyltransferase
MKQRIKAFFSVLRESQHPLRLIVGVVLMKTGLNRFCKVRMTGYRIWFSKSALALTLFSNRENRHEDEDIIKRLLKPGSVYVDIGANIGTLSLTAHTVVGDSGKVIAVEAHPQTFMHLVSNVKLNGFNQIHCINAAAGNHQGSIMFSNIGSDDQNKVLAMGDQGIPVKLDTLDNLLAGESNIDLLKLDVEGYEKFVLEGGRSVLSNTKVVFFESWDKHFAGFGYSAGDVISLFNHAGFEVYKSEGDTLIKAEVTYKSHNCENLLAIKDVEFFCKMYGYRLVAPDSIRN